MHRAYSPTFFCSSAGRAEMPRQSLGGVRRGSSPATGRDQPCGDAPKMQGAECPPTALSDPPRPGCGRPGLQHRPVSGSASRRERGARCLGFFFIFIIITPIILDAFILPRHPEVGCLRSLPGWRGEGRGRSEPPASIPRKVSRRAAAGHHHPPAHPCSGRLFRRLSFFFFFK